MESTRLFCARTSRFIITGFLPSPRPGPSLPPCLLPLPPPDIIGKVSASAVVSSGVAYGVCGLWRSGVVVNGGDEVLFYKSAAADCDSNNRPLFAHKLRQRGYKSSTNFVFN
jgi:hypothetical protein